jgi:KipI family sensor histidine kinase inhibitor
VAYPRVLAFGEGAVLVEFGAAPDLAGNAAAHALGRALAADPPPGLQAVVPGYVSLLVTFDPLETDPTALAADLDRLLQARPAPAAVGHRGRARRVPVVYGGDHGPDLAALAGDLGLSMPELIAAHTAAPLTVYMLGFAPGHPYLGDLPAAFAGTTRLATPRQQVPRGSIGVVGRQSVIYPQATPGGWRLVGRTPIEIWDEQRDPPAYFAPGDQVQFVPIAAEAWGHYAGPPPDW